MTELSSEYTQPSNVSDNHAKAYALITVKPLASSMGAEIENVDLSNIDNAQFDDIADALYRHKMIYFRDQTLSLEDQENFTLRFGEFGIDAYTAGVEGHPNIQRVVKAEDEKAKIIFGGSWHTDSPFLAQPPAISMLYGVDIPPFGGDTIWANTVRAYAALGDTMKTMLAPLRVHMSGRRILAAIKQQAAAAEDDAANFASMDMDPNERTLIDGAYHPLVRTPPVTGEKSLYIDDGYTVGIKGMSEYEAAPLVRFLCSHITQPIFTCRLRWEKNTFTMWDNRICLHHAFNDHDGFRREMLRSIVEGEVPR